MNTENGEALQEGEPLLLTVAGVARLLGVSARTVRRLVGAGRLIAPVKLGGSVRWRADELRKWIASGCPRMADWMKQKRS